MTCLWRFTVGVRFVDLAGSTWREAFEDGDGRARLGVEVGQVERIETVPGAVSAKQLVPSRERMKQEIRRRLRHQGVHA